MSLSCALFILIRYVSIMVMALSNYGYFSTAFTQQACQHYYLMAPIFKALQIMISQVILGIRTFNIARRDRQIGIALSLLYLFSISVEWFTDMVHRTPVVVNVRHCTPANASKILTTWFFYLAVMVYDLVTLTISTTHLMRYNPLSSRVERLVRVLIYDGIGYFVVLSGSNVLNLVLYHTTDVDTQSAGASIAYAVTWIMSQRILINIREMSEPDARRSENVVVARPNARKMMTGLRSQFDSKSHSRGSKSSKGPIGADYVPTSPHNGNGTDMELGIRVCVERSVMVDYIDESEEHSSSWGKPTVLSV
ncbi:hypothetical protein DFH29DRAFT_654488 [Suillus ampliporus]|nr:hypothetical protein DFH29DRAFT_654488 [Suillus ampliporus]